MLKDKKKKKKKKKSSIVGIHYLHLRVIFIRTEKEREALHDPVVEIKIVTRISWERCNLVSIELSENNLRKLRRYNGICENDYGTILKKFKVYFFSYILVAHIYLFNCQVFLLKKGERERE